MGLVLDMLIAKERRIACFAGWSALFPPEPIKIIEWVSHALRESKNKNLVELLAFWVLLGEQTSLVFLALRSLLLQFL